MGGRMTIRRAITGRQRILPGLDAVVLEDGSPVLLFDAATADPETVPTIVQAFIITEAVVYQADDGQHVGRLSDDFSDAIVDMSYGGDQAARKLCRQWIRRPAFSFVLAQPEPRQ
jgi:hypothetical protein